MAFMAAGAPQDSDGVVLVGMPPGGRHDLGALAFATTARRAGMRVRYLGADLPVQDWVEAARRTHAWAAVIGVVIRNDVKGALEVARALRVSSPDIVIAFGGHRAASVPTAEVEGSLVLPADLSQAAGELREALSAA
jgi:MerR family transcriptional regulator, light-induced transcriptional regulator